MANKVSFIIDLQDKFSRTLKKVNKNIKGLGRNAANAARIIKTKLAAGLKKLKVIAIGAFVAIGVSAVLAFKKIISLGADFQDSIADLSSITGAAGKDLASLTKETLRLAKASSISQTEVASAFTQIASAKSELLKDPKSLSVVTEQVLLLANAAGISIPQAMTASINSLNQFKKGADDVARFVNVLAAGSKVGASLVGETAEALRNVGSLAKEFGLSFEEVNTAIQVLAKSGLKASEAGTQFKGLLATFEAFDKGRIAPSKIGIIKTLEALEKLQLSNIEKINEFGKLNINAASILTGNVDLFKQWNKEITGTNVAQEQANKRLSTFNAKVRRLGVSINEIMIKVFLKLEPILNKQAVAFTKWFDSLKPKDIKFLSDGLILLLKSLNAMAKALLFVLKLFKELFEIVAAPLKLAQFISEKSLAASSGELAAGSRGFGSRQKINNLNPQKAVIEGEIVVRATENTKIQSTKFRARSDMNVGLTMAEAN